MKRRSARIAPYLFIAPTFVLILIFSYYAIANAVSLSFSDAKIGFRFSWIGWANYEKLWGNQTFWHSFRNQGVLSAMTVINNLFWPLLAAELLFFIRRAWTARAVKTAFVVPMLVPAIVTILTWRYLYNNNFGFNTLLKALGLKALARNWLNDPSTALWSIIFVGFPFVSGLYFLIFHAGINNIGAELHDAARIDGASSMQVVRYIHLPNVLPYMNVVFTLSLIGSLSGFGLVAATTGGGPGNATMIPAMLMYKVAFGDGNFGLASAMGVALFAVIMILTLGTRKLFSLKGVD